MLLFSFSFSAQKILIFKNYKKLAEAKQKISIFKNNNIYNVVYKKF
jgi:hypothetical protein